ncbi:MAG: hypothetical protein OEZ02_07180 [Anaerolineae bacterium]|nr:hypothetical protein [Anaerolineae bacterium]
MQTEREPFEWLLFYAQWVGANTLAWVAGWAVMRYGVDTINIDHKLVVFGGSATVLAAIVQRVLLSKVHNETLEGELPFELIGTARYYFTAYLTFIVVWWKLIDWSIEIGTGFEINATYTFIIPILVQELVVNTTLSLGKEGKSKTHWRIWSVVIGITIIDLIYYFHPAPLEELIEALSIFGNSLNNLVWPLFIGGLGSMFSGLILVRVYQEIMADRESLVEHNLQREKKKFSWAWGGLIILGIFMVVVDGLLAAKSCGWLYAKFEQGNCVMQLTVNDSMYNEYFYSSADIVISADGSLLAYQGQGHIRVWNLKESKVIGILNLEELSSEDRILWLEFSPNNRFAAVMGRGKNAKMMVWDLETNQKTLISQLPFPNNSYLEPKFSQDSSLLAVNFHSHLAVWDMDDMSLVATQKRPVVDAFEELQFSADGRGLFLSDIDGKISYWDLRDAGYYDNIGRFDTGTSTGRAFYHFLDPHGNVMVLGADEKAVWLERQDGRLHLMDLVSEATESGTEYGNRNPYFSPDYFLDQAPLAAFSPNGELLVMLYVRNIIVWDTRSGDMLSEIEFCSGAACRIVAAYMTRVSISDTGLLGILFQDEIQFWQIPGIGGHRN